ncbi:oxidoreductase [Gordonia sp. ABKF26]|uniref:oxidoreductase n=1 Tax=Gordonia sp. ABKF26 TaxID=3238687 RepID=UPI0034E37C15
MQRSVQYWRIVDVDGASLSGRFPARQVTRVLREAQEAGLDRHLACRDGMVLIAHAEERNERRPMVVLDKVRRENLPSIGDRSGTRKPIGLASGEGLLEPTYCMFGENNVVAMLTSGDGPRAKRLCDYLSAKLSIEVGVDPVLTQDLDQVLDEMRFSSIEVAIPAERIDRDLVGGDWVETLAASRALAQNGGVVHVGMAVGRRGSRSFKETIRQRIRELTSQLRGSSGLSEMQSARVTGTIRGQQRTVDLLADRFVEKVDVDADRLADPAESVAYARQVLGKALRDRSDYLSRVVPIVDQTPSGHRAQFVENQDDGQPA